MQQADGVQGTLDALVTIARTERVQGLYRGLGPTILANAPFSALYYMFYNNMRSALSQVCFAASAFGFGMFG